MNTKKLLGKIHKNAQAGLYTIPKMIKACDSAAMRSELKKQQREYKNIYCASEHLDGYGKLDSLSRFAKLRTSAMITVSKHLASPSKQAEMMIMGSTAGMIDMSKCLNKSEKASRNAVILAQDLLKTEENNITSLKRFL